MHDTEDKQWWTIEWAKREHLFVEKVCPELGLAGSINPAKLRDKYAPDLVVDSRLADLKCQETPFFTARTYGIDSQFAVTFNRKDYSRYKQLYPDLIVYFWIDWQQSAMSIRGKQYSVRPMAGIWRASFGTLMCRIESGDVPLHAYQRRQGDMRGNAKESYLFDVRSFECLKQIGPN